MKRAEPSRMFVWGVAFGVVTFLLLWSRLVGLDLAFWHDEVVTVRRFASQGPIAIFSADYLPNNHVLFEVLAWITTRVLGESEVAYRLWGVIPALAATALQTFWMYRRFGYLASASLLIMITLSPLLLQVSREARGYGLAMLAIAGLVTLGDTALTRPEGQAIWAFALAGTIGVLTLPPLVIPYVLGSLVLIGQPKLRARMAIGLLASGLVSLAWYAPMLAAIVEHSSQQFGIQVPWHGFVTMLAINLVFPVFRLLLPGDPDVSLGLPRDPILAVLLWHAVTWSLMAMGASRLWRDNEKRLLALLAVMPLGTYIVLAARQIWIVDRFASYLSFPVFIMLSLGVDRTAHVLYRRLPRILPAGLVAVAAWWVVSFYPVADNITHVPLEATKDAAAIVNATDVSVVLTNSARPDGFEYYLDSAATQLTSSELREFFCAGNEQPFVFLHHPFRAEEVDTSCLAAAGATRVRLDQRGRGYWIDVWLPADPGP